MIRIVGIALTLAFFLGLFIGWSAKDRAIPAPGNTVAPVSLNPTVRPEQWIEHATLDELAESFDCEEGGTDYNDELILARWIERDANGAIERLLATRSPEDPVLSRAFAIWAELDVDGALAKLDELKERGVWIFRWLEDTKTAFARTHPKEALDRWLPSHHYPWVKMALVELADDDPLLAESYLPQLKGWAEALLNLTNIARVYASKDPAAAFKWADSLEDARHLRSLMFWSMPDDPKMMVELYDSLTNAREEVPGDGALDAVASRLAMKDPIAAFRWVNGQTSDERAKILLKKSIAPALQARDMASFLDQFGNTPGICAAISPAISSARTASDFPIIVDALADRAATDLSNELRQLLSGAVQGWSGVDFDAAITWAEQWSGGSEEIRSSLYRSALAANAITPEKAMELFEQIRHSEVKQSAAAAMGDIFANADPEAGLHWIQNSLQPEYQREAIDHLVGTWIRNQPEVASINIDSMPSGSVKDMAIQTLVEQTTKDDPASAFAWALAIEERHSRSSNAMNVFHEWATKDMSKAVSAVLDSSLSEQEMISFISLAEQIASNPPPSD
ncbi:MAG: hypothetical protein KDN22_00210 [Verrucomicrobiae bacterium]|nr:hypothetical protein [Verrucomicrobiae bacterium]